MAVRSEVQLGRGAVLGTFEQLSLFNAAWELTGKGEGTALWCHTYQDLV